MARNKRFFVVFQGTKDDVNLAVTTAREAFKSWSTLEPHERAKHLYSIARHVQKHRKLVVLFCFYCCIVVLTIEHTNCIQIV